MESKYEQKGVREMETATKYISFTENHLQRIDSQKAMVLCNN